MKKMLIRAAVLAMFTASLGTTAAVVGAGTAMACGQHGSDKSFEFAATLPQVNYGDHNEHVVGLQLALREAGYNLQGTGTYADSTLAAVKDFQRKNGINDSGIVGSKTWAALVGRKSANMTGNGQNTPPNFSINPGERNLDKMLYLHNAWERIYPYSTYPTGSVGDEGFDTHGPKTQSIVQDFQRRVGINPSGIVGPRTWAALYEVIAMTAKWGC